MYKFLFKNRLAAVGFVVLTTISAASLVGTEDNAGLIEKTAQEIEQQKAEFEAEMGQMQIPKNTAPPPSSAEPSIAREPVEFTDDEELIDQTEGFDPTPVDSFDPAAIAQKEEVVIILNNEPVSEE